MLTDTAGAVTDDIARVLATGDLVIDGRLVEASNMAFVATVAGEFTCVYKPQQGERPLWDFAQHSLTPREVAAFVMSRELGFDVIPTTVWRDDGPAGPGMCQIWIEHTENEPPVTIVPAGECPPGWRSVISGQSPHGSTVELVHADTPTLRRVALFDAICNNADRKGGHLLVDPDGRTWAIDHGVTFNEEDKLRTVVWGFAGEPIDDMERLADIVQRWESDLAPTLAEFLTTSEIRRTRERILELQALGVYPYPGDDWPPLPWPLF